MSDFSILDHRLIVDTHGDPEEVLKVKRLPGRIYDTQRERWIVPILPGLAREVAAAYGDQIAALIEDIETRVLEEMKPPRLTPADLGRIGAAEAIERACVFHFVDYHHGDIRDYRRVHPERGE